MIITEYEFDNKWEKEYVEKYIVPFFNKLKKDKELLEKIFNVLNKFNGNYINENFSIEIILWDFFNTFPQDLQDKMLSEYRLFEDNIEVKFDNEDIDQIGEKIVNFCFSLEDWLIEDIVSLFDGKEEAKNWVNIDDLLDQ